MKKDKKNTKVQFLIAPGFNQIYAFFPEQHSYHNGHPEYKTTFDSYSHVGQHSACSIGYAGASEEAAPEQYNDLKKELEQIGYKLKIVKRVQSAFNAHVKINVDLPMLRDQKQMLLNIPFNTKEQSEAIEGIVNLIDGIQDYAADVLKIDESYIYSK